MLITMIRDPFQLKIDGIVTVIFLVFSILIIISSQVQKRSPRSSTWSIVAVDPISGDVGAAGASCVPVNASVLAALVPGKGAAAVQADFVIENRDRVFDLLQEGLPAETIVEMMTTDSDDANLGLRQYGVVTFDDSTVQAAGFTGQANFDWAGDRQDIGTAVSVQGNTLEGEDVIVDALAAFSTENIGPVLLSDRLIRAMEAGSAAGGDKRCNNDGVEQTALSAFIAVARDDGSPFAAPFTQSTELEDVDLPWLYIAVIEEQGGPNPIIDLRRQYNLWRDDNILPCPDCDLRPIDIAPVGQNQVGDLAIPASEPTPQQELVVEQTSTLPVSPYTSPNPTKPEPDGYPVGGSTNGLDLLPLLAFLAVIIFVTALMVLWFRRRRSRRSRRP